MSDEPAAPVREAVQRPRKWWPGWIWSVPVFALVIVAWLILRAVNNQGPSVVVTFETAGGVTAGNSEVKYEDMVVGRVTSVSLRPDLRHADVTLSLHADLKGHLGPGTQFWIIGEHPSLSNLSAITTLISGPYIGIDPKPGAETHHFTGLSEPPVRKEASKGTSFVLHAERLNSLSRGSSIYYRDIKVGELQGYKLLAGNRGVEITAFLQAPYDHLVHAGTRFWDASAVRFSTGDGATLRVPSVSALIEGAVAFETPPEAEAGPPSTPDAHFELYKNRDAAESVPPPDAVAYRVVFEKPTGTLDSGAPVKLMGERIGSVRDSKLTFDTDQQALRLDATLLLDPNRIALTGAASPRDGDAHARLDAMLRPLVEQGLRAELASSVPLVGGEEVALRFVPNAPPAALGDGTTPEIPTSGSSGVQSLIAGASDVVAKIDALPLPQIAASVREATERLAQLSRSPELTNSLRHLDRSLANAEQITGEARGRVAPILAELHRTVQEADSALASAQRVLGSGAVAPTPETAGLPGTLYEFKRAAQSLREFTDFLDRHPEALIQGRGSRG
ncbi:MAG: MCE family protein [Acetobacteraceae bacterium]|nr:MCE family protein [Acetobacteraceae bacterium]